MFTKYETVWLEAVKSAIESAKSLSNLDDYRDVPVTIANYVLEQYKKNFTNSNSRTIPD